jgi:hypothetical protein
VYSTQKERKQPGATESNKVNGTVLYLRSHLANNDSVTHIGLDLTASNLRVIIFNLRTAAFKVYCAIWVRRSNFRHQASPRVSPLESTQRRKLELWARYVRDFCQNADFHVTFRDLLHAVKLRHGTDCFTSPPKEGVLRNFFALKIRRLRPDANPRTWIQKASTLPLQHRSRNLRIFTLFVFSFCCHARMT